MPDFPAIPAGGAVMMDFGCCIDLSGRGILSPGEGTLDLTGNSGQKIETNEGHLLQRD